MKATSCKTGASHGHRPLPRQAQGKKPKLTARQQAELARMHTTGGYTIADLMEVFSVGRATVYRVLTRAGTSTPSPAAAPGPSPNTPA